MSESNTGYLAARSAARELLQGEQSSGSFTVGKTTVILSKVRVITSEPEELEPYPKVDLPPADDYGTWLK
jgi:hypothetical protein